jgi:hypothetical protein
MNVQALFMNVQTFSRRPPSPMHQHPTVSCFLSLGCGFPSAPYSCSPPACTLPALPSVPPNEKNREPLRAPNPGQVARRRVPVSIQPSAFSPLCLGFCCGFRPFSGSFRFFPLFFAPPPPLLPALVANFVEQQWLPCAKALSALSVTSCFTFAELRAIRVKIFCKPLISPFSLSLYEKTTRT